MAAAIAGVAVISAGIAALALQDRPKDRPTAPAGAPGSRGAPRPVDHVVEIDPATDKITASVAVGDNPSTIAFGEGSLWAASAEAGTIDRIDPATRHVTTIHVDDGGNVAFGAGAVWATSGDSVVQIDPSTNAVVRTIPAKTLNGGPIAVDGSTGAVWVANEFTPVGGYGDKFTIWRLDSLARRFRRVFQGASATATHWSPSTVLSGSPRTTGPSSGSTRRPGHRLIQIVPGTSLRRVRDGSGGRVARFRLRW